MNTSRSPHTWITWASGEPINGDKIYHGAMDNGSGVATLLDIAATLHASPIQTRRSLLFLVVTGEEKGLLGSKYFVAHPTVPLSQIVADLNVDMILPLFPLKNLECPRDDGNRPRPAFENRGGGGRRGGRG